MIELCKTSMIRTNNIRKITRVIVLEITPVIALEMIATIVMTVIITTIMTMATVIMWICSCLEHLDNIYSAIILSYNMLDHKLPHIMKISLKILRHV